ncbi:uncharacterized protein LOC122668512 [Telopea speciosissima]|uniref:uncharacterized protein LOC122668512 n=1 Tax=Telopea speciosissima TaxID=54955 RepID=UPI001CC4BFBC|nr:uncharacterized protein LOC122668512 [Telopea speciosissima]
MDHFVRACINATLSEFLSSHILGLHSAKQVWDALAELFYQQSTARKSYLRSELHSINKGSSTITEYLHKVKSLADSLAAIDERVKDSDLVTHTLNGLGPDYLNFVITIENLNPPIAFTELRAKLLTHEQCLHKGCASRNSAVPPPLNTYAGLHMAPPLQPQAHNPPRPPFGHDEQWIQTQSVPYNGEDQVLVGDGKRISISHTGSTTLPTQFTALKLHNVLVVPHITKNLLSISQLTKDNNCSVEFFPWALCVKDVLTGKLLLKGPLKGNLYTWPLTAKASMAYFSTQEPTAVWHQRLGHPSTTILHQVRAAAPFLAIPKLKNNYINLQLQMVGLLYLKKRVAYELLIEPQQQVFGKQLEE